MLISLFIVDGVDCTVLPVLTRVEVVQEDVFAPNLNYFNVEGSGVCLPRGCFLLALRTLRALFK